MQHGGFFLSGVTKQVVDKVCIDRNESYQLAMTEPNFQYRDMIRGIMTCS